MSSSGYYRKSGGEKVILHRDKDSGRYFVVHATKKGVSDLNFYPMKLINAKGFAKEWMRKHDRC